MEKYGVFDIIGPVMVGPSSSHTAGAARIGYIARMIAGQQPTHVVFRLHGSFARTYAGHGTDRALLAGVMGMAPDDERIRDAFRLAQEASIAYSFVPDDLGEVHPNTVSVCMTLPDGTVQEIMGSSIGGGKITITQINGMSVEFDGEYTTVITSHRDKPGVISGISSVLSSHQVNIAFMKVFRDHRGEMAHLILETDEDIAIETLDELKHVSNVLDVRCIKRIQI